MKNKIILTILTLTLCSFLFSAELNIGITGNNRGLLTPCGCKIPSGGLARISTAIDKIKSPKLIIGAGNHFFHHTPMPKEDQIFEQQKAAFQAKMFDQLEYDVINVGQFDLCYGLNVLKSMQKAYSLPLISANLLDLNDELAFPPYQIIQKDDFSIMFVGICHLQNGFNYKIADPTKTLIQMHEKGIFEKADLVILLADVPGKLLSDFVKDFEGIDIIIAAKEYTFTALPVHYNNTALVQMGSQGKHFGILNLSHKENNTEWIDISPLRFQHNSLKAALKENPGNKKKYQRQIKRSKKQLKHFIKDNPNYYGLEMILLDDSIKDDPSIKIQLEEFDKKRQ